MQRFVIVGGGVAGHRAAVELARLSPGASIDLLCDEPHLPYDRPPLSKEILHRSKRADEILLAGATGYKDSGIRYHPNTRAARIDRDSRVVVTGRGPALPYDRLLIATGSRPRRLPAACTGDASVLYLRTLDDAVDLAERFAPGLHVAIVGGGFVGLEVAAAALRRGCRVTVLEAQDRLLARTMPAAVGQWVERLHRAEGADIRLSTSVTTMRRAGAGTLLTGDGWSLAADLVVAGIGIEPNVELAAAAGLEIRDGLVVDAECRTSDPNVFGAGEVTACRLMYGAPRRVESWRSSSQQGSAAAAAMLGEPVAFDQIPSLWSDQFDSNIQVVGFPDLGVAEAILGDPAGRAWTLVALDAAGAIIGGVAINRGRDASALKRAVPRRADLSFMQPTVAASSV